MTTQDIVSRDKAFGRIIGSVTATRPEEVQTIVTRTTARASTPAVRSLARRMTGSAARSFRGRREGRRD